MSERSLRASQPAPSGREHVAALRHAVEEFGACAEVARSWGLALADVLGHGGRLLAAGNGGSAAQAQHLTAELVGRYRDDRQPFSAICLSAETSSLTAIANDYPADELFARQVEAHGRPGDVLTLLSTSGRSPNVVAAARRGQALGLRVWAFTGPRPNPLAHVADDALAVAAPLTATVQELHLVALHIVCAAFDHALAGTCPRSQPQGHVALSPNPTWHGVASAQHDLQRAPVGLPPLTGPRSPAEPGW